MPFEPFVSGWGLMSLSLLNARLSLLLAPTSPPFGGKKNGKLELQPHPSLPTTTRTMPHAGLWLLDPSSLLACPLLPLTPNPTQPLQHQSRTPVSRVGPRLAQKEES